MPRQVGRVNQLKEARLSLSKLRHSRSTQAPKRRLNRKRQSIKIYMQRCFTFSDNMTPNNGRQHTYHENKLLVYAIVAAFRRAIKAMDSSTLLVNWTAIDKEVSRDFHVDRAYIRDLREAFHEDGEILSVDPPPQSKGVSYWIGVVLKHD